ncbi:MAG: holo-ACP synthase [Actinobacteria bacterium]|nr:holo-ACP synthase [Actinomycetota bacterium]
MNLHLGTDLVSIARFEESLARTPGMLQRLFTADELATLGAPPATHRLAARFAAKEAVAKALGAPAGLSWHECEVLCESNGAPTLHFSGSVAKAAAALGLNQWRVSMSHDGGFAMATVVAMSTQEGKDND